MTLSALTVRPEVSGPKRIWGRTTPPSQNTTHELHLPA